MIFYEGVIDLNFVTDDEDATVYMRWRPTFGLEGDVAWAIAEELIGVAPEEGMTISLRARIQVDLVPADTPAIRPKAYPDVDGVNGAH